MFAAVALAVGVAGVSEGTLAAQAATQPAAAGAPTVVLVLRHAERAAEPGPDPALSEAGAARARQLAEAARDGQVRAVFASQFRRTRETAAPLAQAAGVAVAVVGHANTVPALVGALAGRPAPAMGEGDYGDVFVVVVPAGGGAARTLRLRVGG
jgi:broad specificity phosphatase PhoE